ncbi:hypothetical protein [Vibrio parahaemolyticus]|uniref:hypothetical protein n=1 Tax=Vibrio parahaemolyticus TaxID=670 RepID=UPI001780DD5B|nr:hypothetical protein [Vibrio parahaemolyticus]MBD6947929.1 hypothetical protein [Vibrio parahaemolyticus]MBD6959659.1 hypothetical protein [Vibrio parahaemolyticus]MBD6977548.1 hypothetical protein [Vibrio parahaemolyticus]MBD6990473.1 hypothetical protein [Vibrio parahaemolyticus]WOZ60674.1 hypothetical protein RHS38_07450 [Vibrio parahaemolyticus]
MSIKQLRAAIAPCCGLGANRAEVDAALNNVSSQLSTQEQLLVETLNILEHSLKAIRLGAVTEELLQNHYNAVKAIREHFESAQPNELYSVELIAQVQSLTEAEILEMLKQPGQLQPMPKAAPSQIDQVIHGLLSDYFPSDIARFPFEHLREALYSYLVEKINGRPIGETLSRVLVEGGFIIDSPAGIQAQLTRFGSMFKEEMESSYDALQTNSTNLCKSTSSVVVPVEKNEEVKLNEHHLLNIIVDSVTIPWDAAQSIKSIERRVQAAIQQRDFTRAGRLDNVSVAIRNVHNHCQELLNATR